MLLYVVGSKQYKSWHLVFSDKRIYDR